MEKICIVKRRREYAQPEVKVTQPEMSEAITPEVVVSSVAIERNIELPARKPENNTISSDFTISSVAIEKNISLSNEKLVEEFVDKSTSVISITMTKEQSALLQQSEYIRDLLNGTKNDPALDIKLHPDGRLSLNYRFSDSLLLRMLSSSQVCQMLQISRSFLQKLVHEKKLKSYKLGRLRRFLLEDVLEYLSNDMDFPNL
jgi:excisionase family DNA binding protein